MKNETEYRYRARGTPLKRPPVEEPIDTRPKIPRAAVLMAFFINTTLVLMIGVFLWFAIGAWGLILGVLFLAVFVVKSVFRGNRSGSSLLESVLTNVIGSGLWGRPSRK